MLTCCNFPPRLNPPLPLSPHAQPPVQGDWDDPSFAMTELISPQLPRAWSSAFKIPFVLLDDFSRSGWWPGKDGRRWSSRLHSVQALADASEFCVVSVCVVA